MVPFEHQLWTIKDIAEYLQSSADNVMRFYGNLPSFPRPARLPKADGSKTQPRWKAIEVVQWVEGYFG